MNAYQQIRERARRKRDEAIRDARSEYDQTMKRIEVVERSLGAPLLKQVVIPEPEVRKIMDLILEVIPKDRPFTSIDVVELLRDYYPEREFKPNTVRTYMHRLALFNKLKRICRLRGTEVTWAAIDCPVKEPYDGSASLVDVAELVLKESGPMTMLQLTLAVQKRGMRPEAKPRSLMESLRRALCHNQGRFRKGIEGRWRMA